LCELSYSLRLTPLLSMARNACAPTSIHSSALRVAVLVIRMIHFVA
jgi:hypothetical protein